MTQQIIPMAPDMMTEQSSVESLTSTESPLPSLMDSQQSQNSNDDSQIQQCKKDKLKMANRCSDQAWGDTNGNGTNIVKSENNPGSEYIFQQK